MGSVQGKVSASKGVDRCPLASSSLGPVLLSWGQASEAGVWGRTPGRQDVMNVTFSGTENQSRWRQQRCPLYTV